MEIQGDPAESDRLRDEGARMQQQEKRNAPNDGPGEGDQQQVKKRRDEEARGSEEDRRQAEEFEDLCRKQAEKDSGGKASAEDQSRSEEDDEGEEEQASKRRRIEMLELELAVVMTQLGTSAAILWRHSRQPARTRNHRG